MACLLEKLASIQILGIARPDIVLWATKIKRSMALPGEVTSGSEKRVK
ncbi:hypothetical protein [Bradyrhizobium lablabi]|nr:hypothetical protein [Bradyrhizobium lablabi]MBR0692513.1 hypothetical protein [Bradyrhizobium lablabi]